VISVLQELLYPSDRFITKTKREELSAASRRRYPYTVLRIVFDADEVVLQANFGPGESVSAAVSLVRERMDPSAAAVSDSFYLRVPPNIKLSSSDNTNKTFSELGLVPAAVLYFCWSGGTTRSGPALTAATRAAAQPFVDDGLPVASNAADLEKAKVEAEIKARAEEEAKRKADKRAGAAAGGGKAVPKWLQKGGGGFAKK
jgi:hypothetical protein